MLSSLSRIFAVEHSRRVVIFLTLLALLIRLSAVVVLNERVGDGPARASIAYNWARSYDIDTHGNNVHVTYGIWPPGFTLLSGVFTLVLPHPKYSTRVLNAILGSLTVPTLYGLARRLYGHLAALFSATVLTFWPLHAALSATSLSEISSVFAIVLGLLLLMRVAAGTCSYRTLEYGGAVLSLGFAVMTRYETWVLLPVVVGYHFWRTRQAAISSALLIVLLAFPLYWMYANYRLLGDPLPGGTFALEIAPPITVSAAVGLILRKSMAHLGWALPLLPLGIVGGVVLSAMRAIRPHLDPEKVLHVGVAAAFWSFMAWFTAARGQLNDRYLLLGLVIMLPLAGLFYDWLWAQEPRRVLATALVVVAAFPLSLITMRLATFVPWPLEHMARTRISHYLTPRSEPAVEEIVDWLKSSPYRDDALVMTKMHYRSVYLPLYFPDAGSRYLIVAESTIDEKIRQFLLDRRPGLVITVPEDHDFRARVEHYLAAAIGPERLVRSAGEYQVYDIRDLLVADLAQSPAGKKRSGRNGLPSSLEPGAAGRDRSACLFATGPHPASPVPGARANGWPRDAAT
jgi:4-amino-4-deoxy-L-arabinose transferase-like glycosyltransferase